MESKDENEIVKLAQEGDQRACEYLIEKYRYIALNKARTYYIRGAGTQDVVQEGLIGIYKAIKYYKPDKGVSFKSFCYECVKRKLIAALKTANRQKHKILNYSKSLNRKYFNEDKNPTEFYEMFDTGDKVVEEIVLDNDMLANIIETLKEELTEMEYKCFIRVEYLGESYEEIANKLSIKNKSVDNALQRARRKLNVLEDDFKRYFGDVEIKPRKII